MGRAAAGYANYKEGGVGPVFARIVPLAERVSFKMYAATLLQGPAITPPLRVSLTLVLLLHHESVVAEYPNHRLVIAMKQAAQQCSVPDVQFTRWVLSTKQFNSEANNRGLTLSQVYILYRNKFC